MHSQSLISPGKRRRVFEGFSNETSSPLQDEGRETSGSPPLKQQRVDLTSRIALMNLEEEEKEEIGLVLKKEDV